ncbi:MAG: glycosyltransferase family 2 protein, partial [Candidatus Moranbacteria bacterium]|nr:glycosyltransferase family 2 protein [Candidatus Moranbacteria bacterium]
MTQTPLSIIIPHWQNASDLERLLASIPTKKGYEIIVVDDYSDDNCFKKVVELHESYNFTLLKNNGKKSAGTCRNIGLSHATGKWILFADADDFF